MAFDKICVVCKDSHVDEFVFLSGLELETVGVAELLLQLLERRLNQDVLQLSYYHVELICLTVSAAVRHFKVLVL